MVLSVFRIDKFTASNPLSLILARRRHCRQSEQDVTDAGVFARCASDLFLAFPSPASSILISIHNCPPPSEAPLASP